MNIFKLDDFVPSAYLPHIKCSVHEKDRMGKTWVAICTSNGQLLEFCNKKYVNGCEIDCSDARSLHYFVSYNPLCKYYLVQTPNQAIIILRQKELKIFKTFEDILSVEVRDFMNLGRPQIVIEIIGRGPPIVTDLVGNLETEPLLKVQSQVSFTIHSKLQEVNLRLTSAKNLLQEKRNCRMNAMIQFANHLGDTLTCNQETGKVTVLGSSKRRNSLIPVLPDVQILQPWQRFYCGKWIIGIPIHNASLRKMEDIGVIFDGLDLPSLQYKTHIFTFPRVEETGVQWTEFLEKPVLFQPVLDLPVNSYGVIINVLDEPTFSSSSSIKLSGVVVYKEEDTNSGSLLQICIPPVELTVADLVQDKLRSFSSTTSNELDYDLLSCIVTCNNTRLEVQLIEPSQHNLEEQLEELLGFVRLMSLDYFVCKQKGVLEDIIVKVDRSTPWQYDLSLYTSTEKKTLLFIRSLQDILPQHADVNRIDRQLSTIQDAAKSLNEELLLFLNTLENLNDKAVPLSDTNTIELSEDSWSKMKKELSLQEKVTDQLFSELPVTMMEQFFL